jgi:D-alanyl-D-alanine carboxypeptidase (penicillin-binding protein 5/6)
MDEVLLTTDIYISYDYDAKSIMYESNSSIKISPASLTKLMTALLLYESNSLNQQIVTKLPQDYEFVGKVAYLEEGLILTTEELLELLLVYSANDAAYVAAMEISSSIEDFVNLMNLKANEIGMNDTVYLNPDGLDELGHQTTLNDLLILSIYIIENTKILDITSKEKVYINELDKKTFTNTNTIINEGFEGLKTGWTSEAGLTFIGFNQNNSRRVITIVNKSLVDEEKINHFIDTKVLYENSINDFNITNVLNKNDIIYKIYNSESVTSYYSSENLKSFIKSDTIIKIIVKIQNEKILISFDNISLQESINIPSSNYQVNYQFHWSNRFLNNIFNN